MSSALNPLNWHRSKSVPSAFFSLTSNRLPKVARAHNGMAGERRGIGPWEERVPAVPLAPRLSPSKVAARPRHFLLYNRMRLPTECDTRIYSDDVTPRGDSPLSVPSERLNSSYSKYEYCLLMSSEFTKPSVSSCAPSERLGGACT